MAKLDRSRPTSVYGLFTKGGHPLYIGVTQDLRRRFLLHREREFFKMAYQVEYFDCDDWDTARSVERQLIKEMRPIFNKACNSKSWVRYETHEAWQKLAGRDPQQGNTLPKAAVLEILNIRGGR